MGVDQEAVAPMLRVMTCSAAVRERYTQLGPVVVKLGEAIQTAGQLSSQTLS